MVIFEYLSVLVSIVLGLGIAHLLSGLSAVARARKRVTTDWIPLVWALWLLFFHVQVWWAYWDMNNEADWTLIQFAAWLVIPAMTYFLAHLLVPDAAPGADLDLRANFSDVRVPFFVVLAVFWVWAIAWRPLFFGDPIFSPRRPVQAVLAALAIAGAAKAQPRWQAGVLITSLGVWLVLLWLRLELGAESWGRARHDESRPARQADAAETQRLAEIDPWYRRGAPVRCLFADSRRYRAHPCH